MNDSEYVNKTLNRTGDGVDTDLDKGDKEQLFRGGYNITSTYSTNDFKINGLINSPPHYKNN